MSAGEFNFEDNDSSIRNSLPGPGATIEQKHRQDGRITDIHQNGGLQNLNTSANFLYSPNTQEDVQMNDQFNYNEPSMSNQSKRRLQHTSNKTGGKISIHTLRPEDVDRGEYIGRDAITIIEGEFRQFDRRIDTVKRYVENIVTGSFLLVKKDVDLQAVPSYNDSVNASRHEVEKGLLQAQHLWTNRINLLFTSCLGLLGGMSLLHIILIGFIKDYTRFYDLYAPFSMIFNLIFLVLANFGAIFGLTITLIFKQKSEEQQRRLDTQRHRLRMNYTISFVISILLLIALCALLILPKFTNVLYYSAKTSIKDDTIDKIKGLYYLTNGLLILAWGLASMFSKNSIADIEVDHLHIIQNDEGDEYGTEANDEDRTTNE